MKSFLSLLFVASLLFLSCKKELEPQDSNKPSNIVPFTEAANTSPDQSVIPTQPLQNQNTVNPNTSVPPPTAVAKGMNPAHGQPNHRCDIAVGAPLNSPVAPAKSNPETPKTVTTTTTTPNPVATTPTPEGMNPPHGQEKHRCDIAVGAPLPKE